MHRPIGYFFTWTCYGTWLRGDERGAVDRRQNIYGTPRLESDPALVRGDAARLSGDSFELNQEARRIVRDAIRAHCAFKDWDIVALNVRTNHIHLVATHIAIDPEQALGQLKAWATRRLREEGHAGPAAKLWSRHGSTKYLWRQSDVQEAARYVAEGQGPDLA